MQIFLQMNELRYWSWLVIDNVNILVYRLTLSILKKKKKREEEEEEEEEERERELTLSNVCTFHMLSWH